MTTNVKSISYELDFMALATEEGMLEDEISSGKLTQEEVSEKKAVLRSIARKTKRMCVQMSGRSKSKEIPFEDEPVRYC